MTRRTETIDRATWAAMLERLDADTADKLRDDLNCWAGGETCEKIEVSLDSLGRLDSESNPTPA
jgi:hypothetical protein